MSNNATQNSNTKKQDAKSDAASFVSTSSTLCDNKKAGSPSGKSSPTSSSKGTSLSDSSIAFGKKAQEEGWAAPTATRPSFGC